MKRTTNQRTARRRAGRSGRPANYGDATPSDVTMAVLRYRPDKHRKGGGGGPEFNPNV